MYSSSMNLVPPLNNSHFKPLSQSTLKSPLYKASPKYSYNTFTLQQSSSGLMSPLSISTLKSPLPQRSSSLMSPLSISTLKSPLPQRSSSLMSPLPVPTISLVPIQNNILSQPVYPIPTLNVLLTKSPQPYLQKDISRMIETGKESEGRGSLTRGWKARSPKKGTDRHQLMSECGPQCFLKPETEGFPICPRCSLNPDRKCKCQIDCGGVQSALVRSRQWGYPEVATNAEKILQTKCNRPKISYF